MARTISLELSVSGIRSAIKELEEYRDSLPSKTKEFVDRLLDVGIETTDKITAFGGSYGTHGMENRVHFYKELDHGVTGVYGVMVGVGDIIQATWLNSDGIEQQGELSAILALEFGTAGLAVPPTTEFGGSGGQGTNSTTGGFYDNALDWYFITDIQVDPVTGEEKKIWKHATAIHPTRPMLQASNEMISQIYKIAKEVFDE